MLIPHSLLTSATEACPQLVAKCRHFAKGSLRVAQFPSFARAHTAWSLERAQQRTGNCPRGCFFTLLQPRAHRSCARVAVNLQLRPSTRAIWIRWRALLVAPSSLGASFPLVSEWSSIYSYFLPNKQTLFLKVPLCSKAKTSGRTLFAQTNRLVHWYEKGLYQA